MSVSTKTVASFFDEAEIVLQIAANLGKYRRQNQWDNFERALMAMGMESLEVLQHWDDIFPISTNGAGNNCADINWSTIKSNSSLAQHLGIALDSKKRPRNLLLYRLMELHFPDFFEVKVTGTIHMGGKNSRGNPPQRRLVQFPKQPIGTSINGSFGPMSVYRVLSGIEPSEFSERVLRAAGPLRSVLGEDLGLKVVELMISCKMEIPCPRMCRQLARVLEFGTSGNPVTIVGAFCPDYAYETTGDPHLPYRYTFEGLGDGVGLVAQQFVRIVPAISAFFTELGIEHRIVLGIGDFEADSEEVLRQVKLDRHEFLRCCQRSLDQFTAAMPIDLPLKLEMFGEQRSQGRLRSYTELAVAEMVAGRFGRMAELHDGLQDVLNRIPCQYRTFYERWYGRAMEDADVNDIVYRQGGEYAAVARIYEEDFGDNILMLAGDRPEMHRFNAFFSLFPTLCAKRAY